MSKTRNLKYQFLYAIEKNFCEKINKHSLKQTGKQGTEVFSYSQRKNLIDASSNLSNWMKVNYPEIKQVNQITSDHIQGFLNSKTDCSQATLEQYQSQFRKLENLINSTYKADVDYHSAITPRSLKNGGGKLRTDMLTIDNYNKLISNSTNQNFKNALVLSQNFGLRCAELSKLRYEDISEQGIKIVDSKGKRSRFVPVENQTQHQVIQEFLNKQGRVCPVQTASLQQAFCREKAKNGIESASDFHASRKAYATSKFKEYRKNGETVQQALDHVSHNLGHGSQRNTLMKQYICCPIE